MVFQNGLGMNLQGNIGGGDHSYPGVQFAAWNIIKDRFHRRYFPASFLKLVTTPGSVGQL